MKALLGALAVTAVLLALSGFSERAAAIPCGYWEQRGNIRNFVRTACERQAERSRPRGRRAAIARHAGRHAHLSARRR